MSNSAKARAIGINHVALEVGDIDEALEFYGKFLAFDLRSKSATMGFIDLGDQFIALSKAGDRPRDGGRHFGLVVDDKEAVRQALHAMGVEIVSDRFPSVVELTFVSVFAAGAETNVNSKTTLDSYSY